MLITPARLWRLYRLWLMMNPTVFGAGTVLTAAALNDATQSAVATYTPVVTNGGTATFSTRTGFYYKFGTSHLVFMNAHIIMSAAGSGSSDLTVTAPSSISRVNRQLVGCEYAGSGGNRVGHAVANTGGSGATFDAIRVTNANTSGASNLSGAGLDNGGVITIQGFYRES